MVNDTRKSNALFENEGDTVDDKNVERGHQARWTFVSDIREERKCRRIRKCVGVVG
jgi:hypothetical protein